MKVNTFVSRSGETSARVVSRLTRPYATKKRVEAGEMIFVHFSNLCIHIRTRWTTDVGRVNEQYEYPQDERDALRRRVSRRRRRPSGYIYNPLTRKYHLYSSGHFICITTIAGRPI